MAAVLFVNLHNSFSVNYLQLYCVFYVSQFYCRLC